MDSTSYGHVSLDVRGQGHGQIPGPGHHPLIDGAMRSSARYAKLGT